MHMHADMRTHTHNDRQRDRQTARQAGKQTDVQTDRWTDQVRLHTSATARVIMVGPWMLCGSG